MRSSGVHPKQRWCTSAREGDSGVPVGKPGLRSLGICESTFHFWKRKPQDPSVSGVRRVRQLANLSRAAAPPVAPAHTRSLFSLVLTPTLVRYATRIEACWSSPQRWSATRLVLRPVVLTRSLVQSATRIEACWSSPDLWSSRRPVLRPVGGRLDGQSSAKFGRRQVI